jgi:predicted transposase/invertase (TIGR01784 family)
MQNLLSPQNDFVFKRIFGTEENKNDVLLNFLNESLKETEPTPFTDLTLENTFLDKKDLEDKQSILDVRAKNESGKIVNVEIQVAYDRSMPKRTLYYWAKMFGGQLVTGEAYARLKKTIAINIVNFTLFENDRFHNVWHLKEDHTGELLTDDIEIHFMELPKLEKKPYSMDNRLWKWLTFIKGAPKDTWEELAMDTPGIKKAMDTLEFLSQSKETRELALAREKELRDKISAVESARELGREEGREWGEEKGKRKTAQNLLEKTSMSVSEIASITELSESEIQELKKRQ